MHEKRFKDFILRLVVASAHSYFVPAWGEVIPTSKEVPAAPTNAGSQPRSATVASVPYRDTRARAGSADRWRDLLLKGDHSHRAGRRARRPDAARTVISDRYM